MLRSDYDKRRFSKDTHVFRGGGLSLFGRGGGGGGGASNLLSTLVLASALSRPTPVAPQLDDAISQRNATDSQGIRRRLASTALTGAGGLPNLGQTKAPSVSARALPA